MPVNRISEKALRKLVKDPIEEEALCVIKFYSNNCEYCAVLHDYYVEISESYVDDVSNLESIIKINGVPTIASVKTGRIKSRIRILEDPDPPNTKTWYYSKDIKTFIDKERER